MKRTTILAGACLVAAAMLAAACARQDPQAVYPNQQGFSANATATTGAGPTDPNAQPSQYPTSQGYPTTTTAAPAVTGVATSYPPPTTQPVPQPTAAPTATAPAPTQAAPTLFDQGAAAAIKLALTPRVANEAKGMKEDGPIVAGMLQEGSVLTQEFMLNPGRCYTILGQGLPTITQLDLTLSLKPIANAFPVVLAASNTQGANPAISPGKNCYKNPLPVAGQVVLTVKATRGTGPAGAQVYSK